MDFLPFKEPNECNNVQLVVVTLLYGGILFNAADMIGSGSELLLLVPSLCKLVGSVVLPVLGAVPDGMMVLFSGLGPNAQQEISVGVGALAGSTIMLLTIPWFLGIYAGRVNIINGKPNYSAPKLEPPGLLEWSGTGVGVNNQILKNGRAMLLTMMSYFLVQVPASLWGEEKHESMKEKSQLIRPFAFAGCITCSVFFFVYLGYQLHLSRLPAERGFEEDEKSAKIMAVRIDAIRNGQITLRGAMYGLLEADIDPDQRSSRFLELTAKDIAKMKKLLKPFFQYYDTNRDNCLQRAEFGKLMKDLNEIMSSSDEDKLFNSADTDRSNAIDFDEFTELIIKYAKGFIGRPLQSRSIIKAEVFPGGDSPRATLPAGEEEEEEIPDDLANLSPDEQQRRLKIRSIWMMGCGTILVLLFSDPAVNVLNEIGTRLQINPFYISFVLAPLASNASEMVAAYNYGRKKTQKMMTISLSTLLGAACMNNTFCLAIFLALVYVKGLCWTFSAETMSIILVEIWVGLFAMSSNVQTMRKALLVFLAYPASLIFVYVLENVFGFD